MCIFHSKEVEVTDNITVYKVVMKAIYYKPETHWVTPFKMAILNEDVISGKRPFIADDPSYVSEEGYPSDIIGKGYIHAYVTLEAAAKEYYDFYPGVINTNDYELEVYECEIPTDKGTYKHYCWKGMFDDTSMESVAAREMMFVRRVSPDELFDAFMGRTGV